MKLNELLETMRDGTDSIEVCDKTFDWLNDFPTYKTENQSQYDKLLQVIASKINVDWIDNGFNNNNVRACIDLVGFIEENKKAIDDFLEIAYNDEYKPSKTKIETINDDYFYYYIGDDWDGFFTSILYNSWGTDYSQLITNLLK